MQACPAQSYETPEIPMSDQIKHVSDASFDADVLKSDKPVLVDYWAAWCGPCKMIAPLLEEVATEYAGRLPLFHLDLYRLDDAADALAGGLLDERQLEGVALVEWAERLGDALPVARLDMVIDGTGDDPRRIALRSADPSYGRYLEAAG